ncbi:DNL-type zinc finger protein [Fasciolopsis buskii]|uniref:DNL-type zinc finger protein n=1 Tax=Fasciolopsis buskii TaxID=27845 RepID=A0A8E0VCJ1_9TREM|nr:DNL-type zinc finger protein [Fasciolopsis buski]
MLINRFPLALRVRISLSSLRALPAVKNQIHGRIAQTRVQSTYIPHKNFCTNAFPKSVVLQNPADSENNQSDVMGKMYIEFTCKKCGHRSKKYFSKHAYLHGIVIIRCDGCQNLHLIADNLGWIKEGQWRLEDVVKVDYKCVCTV